MKEEEALRLVNSFNFSADKAYPLKNEASGRVYWRATNQSESIILCFLDPSLGNHNKFIDICINNASAIQLTNVKDTEMKRYDLMHQINGRGTYMVSKYCLPHLEKASNPHILNLSPPLDMHPKWFAGTVAYTMAKYTMSMCVLGMAQEFADRGIAVNALWPRTAIATAAVQNHLGGDEIMRLSRNVDIMADAAYEILIKDSKSFSGNFCIDDLVLHEAGIRDFSKYANVPFSELMPDFFVPDDTPLPDEVKNS